MSEQSVSVDEHIKVDVSDTGVMTLRFNRPQALNAVTREVVLALDAAIERAATEARAVVITGDDRSFCSGADLAGASKNNEGGGVGIDIVNRLIRRIRDLQVPTVAAVSGPAAGVGCSLALICDYVVMSEKSYLMLAFTKIGLMPDGGASALIAASAGRHRALRMALTAERIQAATALEWGLASEVAHPESYLQRAQEVAEAFAQGPTLSLGLTASAVNAAALTELDAALDREEQGQSTLTATADFREGVQAFLEKRPAVFEGK